MLKKCILAAAFCVMGTSGAMAKVLHIALDGYCNAFVLHVEGIQVWGRVSGCGKTSIEGGTNATVGGVPYIVTNDSQDGRKHLYTWYFTPPANQAGSWYLYDSTGSAQTEINSGTYTTGAAFVAPAISSGKDATKR